MKLFLRDKTWWYSHGSGEMRVRQSTGCTDRAQAEEKARLLSTVATMRDDADRIETAAALAKAKRHQAELLQTSSIMLADCWDLSPHRAKDGAAIAPNTSRNARTYWMQFCEFAHQAGVTSAGKVTPELAQKFLRSLKPKSSVKSFFVCRSMFSRLKIIPNPFVSQPARKIQTIHREPLTREQTTALLAAADKKAQKPSLLGARALELPVFVRFLLYTGLRMGDAVTCKTEQIDWQTGVLSRTMNKTSKNVMFPLHPELLKRLNGDGAYLFPALAKLYAHQPTSLSIYIKDLMTAAGIKGDQHQYCAHALRTTFASICAEAEVPLPVIQSWLGHSSPTVTRIYARIEDMRAKRAALAKFPSLG